MKAVLALPFLLALTACAPKAVISSPHPQWRLVATDSDRGRLRDWRPSFVEALADARALGFGQAIDSEGALLNPDAALGGGPIPNGDYRCRVIKIGARTAGMLGFIAYPAFACQVRQEGRLQGFAKLSGSQRPVGLIFPGDALRQVFLGTLALGDERRAMQYGDDPDRDVAAFVERIGERRWRMVIPRPAFESKTDVIELIPAS